MALVDIRAGARLLGSLPTLLRHPVRPTEAREILRGRFARRDEDFLRLVRTAAYENPSSPYHRLLRIAGCTYRDLEEMVRDRGIESALKRLFLSGVYLSVDEFKGRQPVVRGGTEFTVSPAQFWNPAATTHLQAHSGGSSGEPTPIGIDLTHTRAQAVDLALFLDARGAFGWTHALWGIPGSSTLALLLRLSACGAIPAQWFSQVDPSAPGLHHRYRWSARLMRVGGLLARTRVPAPEHVSPDDPLPIVRWLRDILRQGRTPHLSTFASAAGRVCLAARDAGIDLRGVQFTVGGEAVTSARLEVIRRAGAQATPRYAAREFGHIAYGCLAPEAPDDVHLLDDLHALIRIEADDEPQVFPAGSLLLTSLQPTVPLFLLNLSLGDQADVRRRSCGCPLEAAGWTTHLMRIHSSEKLTAGGVTFLARDVARALEEALPARFGGAPTDYQIVEDEHADGQPDLRLLVHPSVGSVDNRSVVETFLAALGTGSGAERVMQLLWRDAGMIRVERLAPRPTASGKLLHVRKLRGDRHRVQPVTAS
jgi:hypothetical protein